MTEEGIRAKEHLCPKCGGTGAVGWKQETCDICHGTGHEEQTNEEWLHSLNTEQLIEFLEKITDPHVGYLVGHWDKWLKQPHINKE